MGSALRFYVRGTLQPPSMRSRFRVPTPIERSWDACSDNFKESETETTTDSLISESLFSDAARAAEKPPKLPRVTIFIEFVVFQSMMSILDMLDIFPVFMSETKMLTVSILDRLDILVRSKGCGRIFPSPR